MDFATILKALQAANAALAALPGLIETVNQAKAAWSTEQQDEIDALLKEIQGRNDQGFLETDAKLDAASKR